VHKFCQNGSKSTFQAKLATQIFVIPVIQSNNKHTYRYSSIKAAAPARQQQQHQQGSNSNTSKAAEATPARQQQQH
jgi:hypothetical protein